MAFDPNSKLSNLKGKDYLEVKWRIVWFRDEHPKGQISTEVVHFDTATAAVRAIVLTEDGTVLGTGMAACDRTAAPQGRYLEKAETSAIGRALGIAGYGTQFTGEELSEDDHLSDSLVERPAPKAQSGGVKPATSPAPQIARNQASSGSDSAPKRPYDPQTLQKGIAKMVMRSTKTGAVTDKQRGALKGRINKYFSDREEPDQARHTLLHYLFGVMSTQVLSPQQIDALFTWTDSEHAISEARAAVRYVESGNAQSDADFQAAFDAPAEDAAAA